MTTRRPKTPYCPTENSGADAYGMTVPAAAKAMASAACGASGVGCNTHCSPLTAR